MCEDIQESLLFLKDTIEQFRISDEAQIRLRMRIQTSNAKNYTTIFTLSKVKRKFLLKDKNTYPDIYINFTNDCIELNIDETMKGYITSSIHKNSSTPPCFEPRLVSEPSDSANRITTTDVLQILSTKIKTAISPSDIYIQDNAEIDGIRITPFRLLRGGNPLYQKYGYFNPDIPNIKDILSRLSGNDLKTIENTTTHEPLYKTLKDVIHKINKEYNIGIDFNDTDSLFTIMNTISFDMENEIDEYLSLRILDSILTHVKFYTTVEDDVYKFNKDSPEWKEISKKVCIQFIERIASGGKRIQNYPYTKMRPSRKYTQRLRKTSKGRRLPSSKLLKGGYYPSVYSGITSAMILAPSAARQAYNLWKARRKTRKSKRR